MRSPLPLRLAFGATALTAALVLSGCGSTTPASTTPATDPPRTSTTQPIDSGTTSSATSSTPPTSAPTTPSSPTSPPAPTPTGVITLTGIPEPGVEPSCLVLQGYQLMGGDRTLLTSGVKVTVTGRAPTGLASFCQQGTILQVETVVRAS